MRSLAPLSAALLLSCAASRTVEPAPPSAASPADAVATSPAPATGDSRFDAPYQPTPDVVADPPRFKPSSKSAEAMPITTNAYGAFSGAPDAPGLGEHAEDFRVALASGGTFELSEARAAGPVLLMFYRGFW